MTLKFKLHDFKCDDCDREWEDLSDDETSPCSECGVITSMLTICTGNMGGYSILDEDGKRQMMLKRSAEHTHKELKKNPEQFGELGVKRARAGQVKSFGGM